MKKIVMFFVATFVLVLFTAPVQAQNWVAFAGGSGYTDTSTNLSQFQKFNSCGDSCSGKNFMGMSSQQSGDAGFKLNGEEKRVDKVTGYAEFGYNTGYKQEASSPTGYQASWGTQFGDIGGSMKSR